MKIDYYRVLGIARDASTSEIKQAFRKLALQFHPDRHVRGSIASRESAGHRFKEVSEAYEVLGDDVKRAAYNKGSHYTGSQHTGSSRRYEGPPRRRYYRNKKEGYNTYGSAQARSFYDGSHGVRWKPELSGPERRERIINTIFFGVALPLFLFADYVGAALWPDPSQRKPYSAMNKAVQCTRDDRKAVQTSCSAKKPKASSMKGGLRDQGCKSLLENTSVGYTYVATRGLGNLEAATNLAPKLPDNNTAPTFNPHYLRSLLTPEYRLSDLPNAHLHTWVGQRARILHNRDST